MKEDSTLVRLRQPDEVDDPLTEILRQGARRLLAQAVEQEAEAFLAGMKVCKLADGRDRVVRHGHGPARQLQTGIGPVAVSRVKIRDRGAQWDGSDPFHLGDPAAAGASDAQPGRTVARLVSARDFDRRLLRSAVGPARQGGAVPVPIGDFPTDGGVVGRIRTLAKA